MTLFSLSFNYLPPPHCNNGTHAYFGSWFYIIHVAPSHFWFVTGATCQAGVWCLVTCCLLQSQSQSRNKPWCDHHRHPPRTRTNKSKSFTTRRLAKRRKEIYTLSEQYALEIEGKLFYKGYDAEHLAYGPWDVISYSREERKIWGLHKISFLKLLNNFFQEHFKLLGLVFNIIYIFDYISREVFLVSASHKTTLFITSIQILFYKVRMEKISTVPGTRTRVLEISVRWLYHLSNSDLPLGWASV